MNVGKYWKVPCASCEKVWIVEDCDFNRSPAESADTNLYISQVQCKNCEETIRVLRKEIQGPFSKKEIEKELENQPPPPKFFWEGEKG